MGKKIEYRIFTADFETSVYENQTDTEVWASALVELGTETVMLDNSIESFFHRLDSFRTNVRVYFHNLKFDGSFMMYYLLTELHYEQAYEKDADGNPLDWIDRKRMPNGSFSYGISAQNRWYSMTIKTHEGNLIELRDSYKLLPFSVKRIGSSFGTKHKKLEMEYEGERHAGWNITDEERRYIENDVLVVKEALEIMYEQGHKKLTIGSCCLAEYKSILTKSVYNTMFPDLYELPVPVNGFADASIGDWVRKSYKGGWCYLVPQKAGRVYENGVTADVNSLYPSVMSGDSENLYPTGIPEFWEGDYIPEDCADWKKSGLYYFVRLRTRFRIKPGMLPMIQIKGHAKYPGTNWLSTSDVYNFKTGQYESRWTDREGNTHEAVVELTLTCTDYELIRAHYDLYGTVILGGAVFAAERGIFDDYINKYKKIKMESTGAVRELAKLFLNNLYGKMGASTDSSFKVGYIDEETKALKFDTIERHDKTPGYIPVGSAITSYAREFTIKRAQMNYHGPDKPGFIYADTDSIHCDLSPDELQGIDEHPTRFLCWKLESTWDKALFVRQKTYIEHVTHSDRKPVNPFYDVKCAGMSAKSKELFVKSMDESFNVKQLSKEQRKKYTQAELRFLSRKRTIEDFRAGLIVPGSLKARNIKGGVLLTPVDFKITARCEWGLFELEGDDECESE